MFAKCINQGVNMVDFGKALRATPISIILIVVLNIVVQLVVGFVPDVAIVGLVLFPLNALLFLYAGYKVTKKFKQSLTTAGVAGLFAAFLVGIFMIIANVVFILADLTMPVTGGVEDAYANAGLTPPTKEAMITALVFSMAIWTLLSMITNFVISMIGGFMGQRM